MPKPTPAVTTARAALAVVGVLVALRGPVFALAEPPAENAELRPNAAEKPLLGADDEARVGAATLFMNGFPGGGGGLSEATLLAAGEAFRFWTFYDPDVVREIPPWALSAVRDRTAMTQELGDPELDAYYDMLIYANRTSPAALDQAALREGDQWSKVFNEPDKYRGKVVHFEGRLKKLRQFDPQPMAAQGGVRDYYEGYVAVGDWQDNPLFIEFTELPPGLQTGDKLDVPVAFSGYFFKVFRYTAKDTKETHKDRLAPLVIGRTVTLQRPPAQPGIEEQEGPWSVWLGPLFFGVVGVTVTLLFTLGYWFRSGDRRVRGRVVAARHGDFVAPPHDAPPDPRDLKKAAREQPPPPSPLVDEPPGERPA